MSNAKHKEYSRRLVVAAALVTPMARGIRVAGASQRPAPLSAMEQANLDTIEVFLKAWGKETPNPGKLADFMFDDCIVRIGDDRTVHGRGGALKYFESILPAGTRYDIKILESFARGPLVANYRIDHTVKNNVPDAGLRVTATFSFKNNKIWEWYEYDIGAA
jgi:limonene-1,2-epoxide hydrolase